MTKHADELAAKAHLGLEDAKVITSTAELVCDQALVVCNGHVKPLVEIAPVRVSVNALRGNAEEAMEKLYDMESHGEPEKKLNLNLNLYQMENY